MGKMKELHDAADAKIRNVNMSDEDAAEQIIEIRDVLHKNLAVLKRSLKADSQADSQADSEAEPEADPEELSHSLEGTEWTDAARDLEPGLGPARSEILAVSKPGADKDGKAAAK